MALHHSSVIVNTGATQDTRARDQLSWAIPFRPQALTLYVRLVLLHDDFASANNRAVIQIGSNSTTNPRLLLDTVSSVWRFIFLNGIGSVQSAISTAGFGVLDKVELRGVVNVNGSVLLGIVRNSGAESLGATSAALTMPLAWTNNVLWTNSVSTASVSFCAYRNIEVMAGVHTMQEMRRYAGTD